MLKTSTILRGHSPVPGDVPCLGRRGILCLCLGRGPWRATSLLYGRVRRRMNCQGWCRNLLRAGRWVERTLPTKTRAARRTNRRWPMPRGGAVDASKGTHSQCATVPCSGIPSRYIVVIETIHNTSLQCRPEFQTPICLSSEA